MQEQKQNARSSRVAMLVAPKTIELRGEEIPSAPPGGIVVRVRAALTDGTDLKTYRRGHPKMPMPTRFGHEFSGDIAAIGEGVKEFAVGDAIMSVHTAPCGTCFWCKNNQEELCETIMSTMILGAYSDHIVIPERILKRNTYKKPAHLSYTEAAFLEPLSCVIHSVNFLCSNLCHPEEPTSTSLSTGSERLEGRTVAIIGNGAFGILHAQVLTAYGATAILIGRNDRKNAIVRSLGITTIHSAEENPLDAVLTYTENRGADVVIECTGSPEVWQEAPLFARRGGIVSFFGGLPSSTQVAFQASRMHYDEIRLVAPFHLTPAAVRTAYEFLCERKFIVAQLISGTFSLDDIAEVFDRLDRGKGLKYAIEP